MREAPIPEAIYIPYKDKQRLYKATGEMWRDFDWVWEHFTLKGLFSKRISPMLSRFQEKKYQEYKILE